MYDNSLIQFLEEEGFSESIRSEGFYFKEVVSNNKNEICDSSGEYEVSLDIKQRTIVVGRLSKDRTIREKSIGYLIPWKFDSIEIIHIMKLFLLCFEEITQMFKLSFVDESCSCYGMCNSDKENNIVILIGPHMKCDMILGDKGVLFISFLMNTYNFEFEKECYLKQFE